MVKVQVSEMLAVYKDPEGTFHITVDVLEDPSGDIRSALYPLDSGGVGFKVSPKSVTKLIAALVQLSNDLR